MELFFNATKNEITLRIGIDATCLPPSLAGAGRYVHGMIRGLAGLDRNNEYFIFLKAQDSRHFENLPPNMRRLELPDYSRPMRLAWQHLRAGEQAQRLRLDVWHGTHYTLPRRVSGVRYVATFHDLGVFLHPQFYPAGKRYYFQQTFFHAARIAHGILAVSEVTAKDFHRLVSFGKLPQQPGEVQAIASGVNEEFFALASLAEKNDARRKYAGDSRYILFVGTAEKRKNLGMLIQAFHRLCQRGQDDHVLLLAGQSGNGSAEIAHAISACSLQNRVKCLGYVDDADLPALYQAADLVVLPSLYEGFGFPALEAMAGGVVTLAANNSAMREMVGHAAMLCENEPEAWAAKMEELLNNQALRGELIAYGRSRAQHFSWRSTAQKLLALYERLHAAKMIAVFDLSANGAAKSSRKGVTASKTTPTPQPTTAEAVLRTIAYADLFDYPLRLSEIHDGLLEARASRVAVSAALQRLQQQGIVSESEGFFFLSDRRRLPEIRRQRNSISHRIIEHNHRILAMIKNFPFVRGLALSGALAFENGKEGDDLDLCLIVDSRRLWTAYLGLVLLTKLLGKRRLVCLNCLIGAEQLEWRERDFFVAHQIAFLLPLSGAEYFRRFWAENSWSRAYLPQINVDGRLARGKLLAGDDGGHKSRRKIGETVLALKPFNLLESLIFYFYRRRIQRMTQHLQADSVTASAGQIMLFTNNHRGRLTAKLEARLRPWLAKLTEVTVEVEENYAAS